MHGYIIRPCSRCRYWLLDAKRYYNSSRKKFYRCPLDGCLGGDHTVGGAKAKCDYGYEGICCAICSKGMFKRGFRCEPCEVSSILPFFLLIIGSVVAVTIAVALFRK